MKVRNLFLGLALALGLNAFAGTPVVVVFYTHDGEKIGYLLADKPVCKYLDNNTKFEVATTSIKVEYDVANLRKFEFSDDLQTGVKTTALSSESLSQSEGVLTFSGFRKGTRAAVYASDGLLVATAKADAAGNAQISLAAVGKGVYIAKAGSKSIKITKR